MRLPLAIAGLSALCTGALAAPSPLPAPPLASIAADSAIYLGPSGVLLEASYFGAPQPRYGTSRVFPCRLHLRAGTRQIAQACD